MEGSEDNMGLPLSTKQAPHYRLADRKMKAKILDEFIATTGYNRKYALHLLTHWGKETFLTLDGKPVKFKQEKSSRMRQQIQYIVPRKPSGSRRKVSPHPFVP
jgi:hypothetical protein